MSNSTLIVMAAGIGSRYGGLKQIEPIGPNGENTIEYSVYDALQAGFEKVVFVINREIEKPFRDLVGKRIEKQCNTIYVFQELDDLPAGHQLPSGRVKPWGTAHAVLSCKNVIDSLFAVINADDYYGPSSYFNLLSYMQHVPAPANHYCMVGYGLENTLTEHGYVSRGICRVNPDGYLIEVQERTRVEKSANIVQYSNDDGKSWSRIAPESIASMNFWGFQADLFAELEISFSQFLENPEINLEIDEYFLPAVVQKLIQEKKAVVKVLPTREKWFGVTYQEDKSKAQRKIMELIRRRVYPDPLWRLQ